MIHIRKANACDAETASNVLCESICELCQADHEGDPRRIADWIANKTPEHILAWLADPGQSVFIAERNGVAAGVGSFDQSGEILLNYVSPAHRFCGVSRALLARLEKEIAKKGISRARLASTKTAYQFYLDAGWKPAGDPIERFNLSCQSLVKDL